MAANDKATEDAINNLVSMFSNIDRDMITDIFLGCKKDFDSTVDQLINMGAEQDKKPQAKPVTTPTPKPVASPPMPVVTPATAPGIHQVDDYSAETTRLEALNQQLSQEYKRLAAAQESNMQLDRQLSHKQTLIVAEQQRLDEEKRKLEVLQETFQQDKRRLEEHLSARLREMKEQMRKSEEEYKEREEESRRLEELAREERYKVEEEARQVEKAAKREQKRIAKEEKTRQKQILAEQESSKRADDLSNEQQAIIDELRMQHEGRTLDLEERNAQLSARVVDLEGQLQNMKQIIDATKSEATKTSLVESLGTLSQWLQRAAQRLEQRPAGDVAATDLQAELRNSLSDM